MAPLTFALAFLGCRANQAELDALRSLLLAHGGREVPYPGPADLLIVNTCAVTGSAEAQSRQALRRAARLAGNGLLVATGCAAQLAPEALARIPGVAIVAGNAAKGEIESWLARAIDARSRPGGARSGAGGVGPRAEQSAEGEGERPPAEIRWRCDPTPPVFLARGSRIPHRRSRAVLKVQDGCDQDCTYCIVRRLRGPSIWREPADALEEARRLTEAGFREIILTGINLGLYGVPAGTGRGEGALLEPAAHARLIGLLEALSRLEGLGRLRLSSIEPMALSEPLLEAIGSLPTIAPCLHLPIQSGDDETLRRMGRPYGTEELRKLAARVAAGPRLMGLGADVIAGFPGESEEAFARTLELLEELPVTYLHAFAYSERPGTPAAELPGRVPAPVRRERVARLRALDGRLRLRFQERLRGRLCRILAERVEGEEVEGWSGEYVRMRGRVPAASAGELIAVRAGESLGPRLQSCVGVEEAEG